MIKELKLQPSEIDRLEFYRFEYLIENYMEWRKQVDEKSNNEDNNMSIDSYMKDAKSMFNSSQNNITKSLKAMDFKMPKL
jgi:hypothetical protein